MTATLAVTDPALLDFAEQVGREGPVAVEGRRTRWTLGGLPTEGTRLVGAPTGIVDHTPEEMTVRVRAGTTVAELHAVLAETGQRTALPERGGTVGGALAVGENDHRALGRGLLRTAPLQVRYVSAEGKIVSSGGPTVKNVTGFDLPRLMVGSLGTLGLLAEVILRTNPIPPASIWLAAEGADPAGVYDALLAPSSVLWDGRTTWVQLEGHPPDVTSEVDSLAGLGSFDEVAAPPALPEHRWSFAPADLPRFDGSSWGRFVACIGLGVVFADTAPEVRPLTSEIEALSRRVKESFDPAGRLNPGRDPGRK